MTDPVKQLTAEQMHKAAEALSDDGLGSASALVLLAADAVHALTEQRRIDDELVAEAIEGIKASVNRLLTLKEAATELRVFSEQFERNYGALLDRQNNV